MTNKLYITEDTSPKLNREGCRDIRSELAKMVQKGFISVIHGTSRKIIGWEFHEDALDAVHENLDHIPFYWRAITIGSPCHPAVDKMVSRRVSNTGEDWSTASRHVAEFLRQRAAA
jgi:hypothetical protein